MTLPLSSVPLVVEFWDFTMHTMATLRFTRTAYTQMKPKNPTYAVFQRCERQHGTSSSISIQRMVSFIQFPLCISLVRIWFHRGPFSVLNQITGYFLQFSTFVCLFGGFFWGVFLLFFVCVMCQIFVNFIILSRAHFCKKNMPILIFDVYHDSCSTYICSLSDKMTKIQIKIRFPLCRQK